MPTDSNARSHQLGLYSCLSFVVGNIVGSGIFVTPQLVLKQAGSLGLALLLWGGCGLFTILGGIVFLELGTAIPSDGGDFAYTKYAGWRNVAFGLMTISVFVGYPGAAAVQSNTFGSYLVSGLNPFIEFGAWSSIAEKSFSVGLLIVCTIVNYLPVGKGASRFQISAVIAKALVLFTIIGFGMYHLFILDEHKNIDNPFAGSNFKAGAITIASYQALWAYAGWDILNTGTPSVKNPKVTLPIAIIGGLLFVIILYLLLNVSFVTILGVAGMKGSAAIASDFARKCMGPLHVAVPFATALMFVSTVNGSTFALSRIMSKAAEEGQLPKFLAVHHKKYNTPIAALLVQLILSLCMLPLPIQTIIEYVSVIMWLQKGTSAAALLKIRLTKMEVDEGVVRVPIILSLIFLVFCVAMTVFPFFLEDEQRLMVIVGFGAVFITTTFSFGFNWFSAPERLTTLDDRLAEFACWVLNGEIKENAVAAPRRETAEESVAPEAEQLL